MKSWLEAQLIKINTKAISSPRKKVNKDRICTTYQAKTAYLAVKKYDKYGIKISLHNLLFQVQTF